MKEERIALLEELNNAIRYHVNIFFYDKSDEEKSQAKERLRLANKKLASFDHELKNQEQ